MTSDDIGIYLWNCVGNFPYTPISFPEHARSQVKGGHSSGEIELILACDWLTADTAICVQAQTANIFARFFTFETGRLPLETEMYSPLM
jgi:hypothetical protein